MLILFGTRRSTQPLGRVVHGCARCRQQAWFTYVRTKRYFTVFFIPLIPLIPLGSTTMAVCGGCGRQQSVPNAAADQVLALAARAQQPAQLVRGR